MADIVATEGMAHWVEMLNNEFGGMQEVLTNLYPATGDMRMLR